MSAAEQAARRATALKYLTLGLLAGLLFAPRAGNETWARIISTASDLFGGIGGNEFTEPS